MEEQKPITIGLYTLCFLTLPIRIFCIVRGQDSGPGLCENSIPWFIAIGNGHFAIPAWLTIICFQTLFLQ